MADIKQQMAKGREMKGGNEMPGNDVGREDRGEEVYHGKSLALVVFGNLQG
jgi:hypothetical protein